MATAPEAQGRERWLLRGANGGWGNSEWSTSGGNRCTRSRMPPRRMVRERGTLLGNRRVLCTRIPLKTWTRQAPRRGVS